MSIPQYKKIAQELALRGVPFTPYCNGTGRSWSVVALEREWQRYGPLVAELTRRNTEYPLP